MYKKSILFMDTETIGVPKNYKSPPSDTENWPRLVQIGYIFVPADGGKMISAEHIIKPVGFEIPVEASNIHGVTTERALAEGVDIGGVLDTIKSLSGMADVIAGHNVSFDLSIVGAEFYRYIGSNPLEKIPSICTMKSTVNFCALPGNFGHYKWPKLWELYLKLFGTDMGAAHTALMDIENTRICFDELLNRGIIKL